LSQVWAVVAHW